MKLFFFVVAPSLEILMKRYRDTPPKEETGHLCFGHKKAPAGGFSVINDGHHQSYHERITRTSVCIFRRRCHLLWPERESGKTGAFWRDICDQDHSLRFVSVKFKFGFCVSNCLPVEIPERFKVAPPVQLFFFTLMKNERLFSVDTVDLVP